MKAGGGWAGGFFSEADTVKTVYLWWAGGLVGRGGGVFWTVVYRTALPINPCLSFSQVRWNCILKALRSNDLCVFMSRKVKTVLNEGSGGAMILFRFFTEPNRQWSRWKMHLPQALLGVTDGFVNVDPLDIFACWCTYPCISPFVWRGWLIQKRLFWMLSAGQIMMFWIWNIAPKKKIPFLRRRNT